MTRIPDRPTTFFVDELLPGDRSLVADEPAAVMRLLGDTASQTDALRLLGTMPHDALTAFGDHVASDGRDAWQHLPPATQQAATRVLLGRLQSELQERVDEHTRLRTGWPPSDTLAPPRHLTDLSAGDRDLLGRALLLGGVAGAAIGAVVPAFEVVAVRTPGAASGTRTPLPRHGSPSAMPRLPAPEPRPPRPRLSADTERIIEGIGRETWRLERPTGSQTEPAPGGRTGAPDLRRDVVRVAPSTTTMHAPAWFAETPHVLWIERMGDLSDASAPWLRASPLSTAATAHAGPVADMRTIPTRTRTDPTWHATADSPDRPRETPRPASTNIRAPAAARHVPPIVERHAACLDLFMNDADAFLVSFVGGVDNGSLSPGTRLNASEIARQWGFGADVARRHLGKLAAVGIVDSAGHGYRVAPDAKRRVQAGAAQKLTLGLRTRLQLDVLSAVTAEPVPRETRLFVAGLLAGYATDRNTITAAMRPLRDMGVLSNDHLRLHVPPDGRRVGKDLLAGALSHFRIEQPLALLSGRKARAVLAANAPTESSSSQAGPLDAARSTVRTRVMVQVLQGTLPSGAALDFPRLLAGTEMRRGSANAALALLETHGIVRVAIGRNGLPRTVVCDAAADRVRELLAQTLASPRGSTLRTQFDVRQVRAAAMRADALAQVLPATTPRPFRPKLRTVGLAMNPVETGVALIAQAVTDGSLTHESWTSAPAIAEAVGVDRESVLKAIQLLVDAKLLVLSPASAVAAHPQAAQRIEGGALRGLPLSLLTRVRLDALSAIASGQLPEGRPIDTAAAAQALDSSANSMTSAYKELIGLGLLETLYVSERGRCTVVTRGAQRRAQELLSGALAALRVASPVTRPRGAVN